MLTAGYNIPNTCGGGLAYLRVHNKHSNHLATGNREVYNLYVCMTCVAYLPQCFAPQWIRRLGLYILVVDLPTVLNYMLYHMVSAQQMKLSACDSWNILI